MKDTSKKKQSFSSGECVRPHRVFSSLIQRIALFLGILILGIAAGIGGIQFVNYSVDKANAKPTSYSYRPPRYGIAELNHFYSQRVSLNNANSLSPTVSKAASDLSNFFLSLSCEKVSSAVFASPDIGLGVELVKNVTRSLSLKQSYIAAQYGVEEAKIQILEALQGIIHYPYLHLSCSLRTSCLTHLSVHSHYRRRWI